MSVAEVVERGHATVDALDSVAAHHDLLLREQCVVVERAGRFAGLLTVADVVERGHVLVADCVTPKPGVTVDTAIDAALELMRARGVQFLPVLRGERLEGVVSYRSIAERVDSRATGAGAGRASRPGLQGDDLDFLAAGLAHDLNNLLLGIGGLLQLEDSSVLPPEQRKCSRGLIDQALGRAERLTAQFVQLSTGGSPARTTRDIGGLLAGCVELFTMGTEATLSFNCASDLPEVGIDPDELCRVVGNLVINALQASAAPAELTIDASRVVVESAPGRCAPGSYVKICVGDRGRGIDPAALDRVFDAGYSARQGGAGLGLANVRTIVEKRGGFVSVRSTPGQGSRFVVHLPCAGC